MTTVVGKKILSTTIHFANKYRRKLFEEINFVTQSSISATRIFTNTPGEWLIIKIDFNEFMELLNSEDDKVLELICGIRMKFSSTIFQYWDIDYKKQEASLK